MKIRMAHEDDFAQWVTLWKGYQVFYKTNITEATTDTTWSRFLDPAEPMYCGVAEVDGKLIGMVHYNQHRSCWTAGDYIYLQDLFVDPDIRGQGVGRLLIEHVYTAAAEAGSSRVSEFLCKRS